MDAFHLYERVSPRGAVYKGRRKKTIEYVAVKRVDKTRMQEIQNQVFIMHPLRHPNVLRFHVWYATEHHVWLILEYCAGGCLADLLAQDRCLPEHAVRMFGRDIAAGLQYVHSKATVFCDLKLSNVLVDENGYAKLSKFRCAQKVPSRRDAGRTHVVQGSPAYMAPELFQPHGVHSTASDLWSLGCVLYELLTGAPPFGGDTREEVIRRVMYEEPPVPFGGRGSRLSPDLKHLLGGLLQKNPADRCTWPAVLSHPFWKDVDPVTPRAIPEEPAFRHMLATHYSAPASSSSDAAVPPTLAVPSSPPSTPADRVTSPLPASTVPMAGSGGGGGGGPVSAPSPSPAPSPTQSMMALSATPYPHASGLTRRAAEPHSSTTVTTRVRLKLQVVPATELLFSPHDFAVDPVVANPAVERVTAIPPPAVDAARWTPERLEATLTDLFRGLSPAKSGSAPHLGTRRMSHADILNQCMALVQVEAVANVVVNSSLMKLWLKLFKRSSTASNTRCKLALCMGLAVRYSAHISPSIASDKVMRDLRDGVCHETHRGVRRGAVAVLGELLFYVATTEDSRDREVVPVPGVVPALYKQLLGSREADPVVQHYAAKTLENVLSQGHATVSARFATEEFARLLVDLAVHARSSRMRRTCAVAVVHCLRVAPALMSRVMDLSSDGWRLLRQGFRSNHPTAQLVSLNLLNLGLVDVSAPRVAHHRSLRAGVLKVTASTLLPSVLQVLSDVSGIRFGLGGGGGGGGSGSGSGSGAGAGGGPGADSPGDGLPSSKDVDDTGGGGGFTPGPSVQWGNTLLSKCLLSLALLVQNEVEMTTSARLTSDEPLWDVLMTCCELWLPAGLDRLAAQVPQLWVPEDGGGEEGAAVGGDATPSDAEGIRAARSLSLVLHELSTSTLHAVAAAADLAVMFLSKGATSPLGRHAVRACDAVLTIVPHFFNTPATRPLVLSATELLRDLATCIDLVTRDGHDMPPAAAEAGILALEACLAAVLRFDGDGGSDGDHAQLLRRDVRKFLAPLVERTLKRHDDLLPMLKESLQAKCREIVAMTD